MTNLQILHLVGLELDDVTYETFSGLHALTTLSTDDYRLCCIFSNISRCSVIQPTPFDSCSRLMPHGVLRIAMWIIGFGALIGNSMVIIFRFRHDMTHRKGVQRLFITNLAIADFLMGVYMVVIASVDVYYGEHYFLVAPWWRESNLCRLAGFIAVLSSESTVFLLALISLDRFISISYPFGAAKLGSTSGRVSLAIVWLLSFALSFVPIIVGVYYTDFYGFSDVCVGLPFNTKSVRDGFIHYYPIQNIYTFVEENVEGKEPYWEYSIALFLGINFAVFILIFICYVIIFVRVKRSSKIVGAESMKRERTLTFRMALIIATDFCCWMPVIIMGLMSQIGAVDLPASLHAWAVAFLLPINSTLNPYLYTFVAMCGRNKASANSGRSATKVTKVSTISKSVQLTPIAQNGE
ncbi:G-protein coupled receptor GRL101-like [Diadema antillarum]|uniref:G-protein coupled receptor GRL101-like n=1 Tax=Diadema antillarum TaxID=105358 RepID=UPI003A85468B